MIVIVIVAFVLTVELIKLMLPVLVVFLIGFVFAAVMVWLSEPNASARREKIASKAAAKRHEAHAKAIAIEKEEDERQTSIQREDGLQKIYAKEREIKSSIDAVDSSLGPFPGEIPIAFFGRKLKWCLFKADVESVIKARPGKFESGFATLKINTNLDEYSQQLESIATRVHQKGVKAVSQSNRSAKNDTAQTKITEKNLTNRTQANPQKYTVNESVSRPLKEARTSLLFTVDGITETERIRAVGTALEDSYEKLSWILNKKQTRMLIGDARKQIHESDILMGSDILEREALARKMETTETQLWDLIVKGKKT